MKILLLILSLSIFVSAYSQENPFEVATSDSATYLVKMIDNTTLSGKILDRTSSELVFQDISIGKVTIPIKNILKLTKISNEQHCIVTTNDGNTFTGLMISNTDEAIVIRTESLGDLTISNSKIREIKLIEEEQIVDGKYFFENPHPTRYLFGPTAIPMKKGEGYYQNAYILANSVQVGVSDNFSMGGGIVIPFLFFITPKVGYKVGDKLYLGGGLLAATTISNDFGIGFGVAYGTMTYGNKESNITISAGWGAVKEENYKYDPITSYSSSTYEWRSAKKPMFSISAMTRLAPKLALVTENWVFPSKEYESDYYYTVNPEYSYPYRSVITVGFRIMGEKNSFDIALAVPTIEDFTMGVPYLDYVFKF